ncbi:MAG: bifunctional isocitrate dehydrogenase kinase/phosphatase [Deltaproteobacteria bacterium]|jgi:isocitrate dehydrogenase kinase/phosphatase
MTSTNDNLSELAAKTIRHAFDLYQRQFYAITRRAEARFQRRDWPGIQADAGERLDLYKKVVDETVVEINRVLGGRVNDPELWMRAKVLYAELVVKLDLWELAETFFNSITRRVFATIGVNPQIEFVDTCSRIRPTQISQPVYRSYANPQTTTAMIETILRDYNFAVAYEDLEGDVKLVAASIEDHLNKARSSGTIQRVDMLNSVLYRGKGAYLIGRFLTPSHNFPLVLTLLNTPAGMVVDAVLLDEDEVSILFSFTRSYFHVKVRRPSELVAFLKSIMPRKRVAELYISIGYNKHGKSELYCDLLQHLESSKEKFQIAEGERGMVMEVFTMPDYDLVFKVIKDRFPPSKNTTREEVMAKYYLVFKHDRAGRLVDAQEFEHLKFNRSRFSEDLLEQLQCVAPANVEVDDDHLVIKHAYVERRVTPLNIYLDEVDEIRARAAVVDYGQAIKDLAATNIFPGDMLLKNFGVTRHGRVVFYDYDELSFLSECIFRVMPTSTSYEEELSAEPWFSVGENDIFPEEFRYFLGLKGNLKDLFLQKHAELLGVDFWHQVQGRIKAGKIIDIFPYNQHKRLRATRPQNTKRSDDRGQKTEDKKELN